MVQKGGNTRRSRQARVTRKQRKEKTWLESNLTAPTPYKVDPILSRKFQWSYLNELEATNTRTITFGQLRRAVIALSATGTSFQEIISSIRVNRVDFWILPAKSGIEQGYGKISVRFAGTNDPNTERSLRLSDTNAHMAFRPPAHSSIRWWHVGADDSDEVFRLYIEALQYAQVLISMDVDMVISATASGIGTIGSHSPGIYYTALDNSSGTPLLLADCRASDRVDTQLT